MTRSDRLPDHRTAATGKPPAAYEQRRDRSRPTTTTTGPPDGESDVARHHLHRFFEELLKQVEE